jgi:hypothetical protein
MVTVSKGLSIPSASTVPDEDEKKASKIIPQQTDRAKTQKFEGYDEYIKSLPGEIVAANPYTGIVNTSETAGMADGKRNLLQIKKMVDAEFEKESPMKDIINYFNILKEAGLMKF